MQEDMIVDFYVEEGILHGPYPDDFEIDLVAAKQIIKDRLEFVGEWKRKDGLQKSSIRC